MIRLKVYEDHYHSNFGDFAVTPLLRLSESQDFSQVLQMMIRTPTGSIANGNWQSTLSPVYEFRYGGLSGEECSEAAPA